MSCVRNLDWTQVSRAIGEHSNHHANVRFNEHNTTLIFFKKSYAILVHADQIRYRQEYDGEMENELESEFNSDTVTQKEMSDEVSTEV